MLLDLRSLFEEAVQAGHAAADRLIKPLRSRVRYTVHTWTGRLVSGPDTLSAICQHPRTKLRRVLLSGGVDTLAAISTHIRRVGPQTVVLCEDSRQRLLRPIIVNAGVYFASGSDDDDLDLAIFEEEENRARKQQE